MRGVAGLQRTIQLSLKKAEYRQLIAAHYILPVINPADPATILLHPALRVWTIR